MEACCRRSRRQRPQLSRLRGVHLVCRHAVVPFVSKRWRDLAYSPALLRQLAIQLNTTDVLSTLDSLLAGLLRRAAGQTKSLQLALDASLACLPSAPFTDAATTAAVSRAAECDLVVKDGEAAVHAALSRCLGSFACTGPHSLSRLALELRYVPLHLDDPWATAVLRNVRQLSLRVHGAPLCVPAPLHALGSLAELSLEGAPLVLEGTVRLPAGLTKLHMGGVEDANILGKVGAVGATPLAKSELSEGNS